MNKEYYEFIINVPDRSREAVMNKVSEMGSLGSYDKEEKVVAYFEKDADIPGICRELDNFHSVLEASDLDPAFSFDYSLLPDKDWNESWKKSFRPINVGKNLTIVPSWIKPDRKRIDLIIDPGMAFGTGHHETTRRCLLLVEEYSENSGAQKLLDVGTGTGILAIGAAKTGFSSITAVDMDETAVNAAMKNIKLNRLDNIIVFNGTITETSGKFDVITANLISETLVNIASHIASRLSPNGIAILSGMIKGQEGDVLKAFRDNGLYLIEQFHDDKWVTIVMALTDNNT